MTSNTANSTSALNVFVADTIGEASLVPADAGTTSDWPMMDDAAYHGLAGKVDRLIAIWTDMSAAHSRPRQNPEFYAAQAVRRSTHDKPRIISCAELTSHHVALPRGRLDAVRDLLASVGIAVTIEDAALRCADLIRIHRGTAPEPGAGDRRPVASR